MAILVATGIQSPFPHPTWFVSAGMFQLGRQPARPRAFSLSAVIRAAVRIREPHPVIAMKMAMTGENEKALVSTRRVLFGIAVLETISKHPSWPPIPGWAKIKVMVRDTDPSS